jgi:hypothetical protein
VVVKSAPRRYPDENIRMERAGVDVPWWKTALGLLGVFAFAGLLGVGIVACGDDDDTYVPDYTGQVAGPVVIYDGQTEVHCFYTGSGLWCYVPSQLP